MLQRLKYSLVFTSWMNLNKSLKTLNLIFFSGSLSIGQVFIFKTIYLPQGFTVKISFEIFIKVATKNFTFFLCVSLNFSSWHFWDMVLVCRPGLPKLCYIAQASLESAAILLPWPPKCWDYRHAPPCLALHILFLLTASC